MKWALPQSLYCKYVRIMILSRTCGFFAAKYSRLLQTITGKGLSPHKLALTICVGSAVAILPLPWGSTLVCLLLAYLLKLNHVAIQSLNYLLYPLQLALLIPYFKLGVWLFPWGPPFPTENFLSTFHKGFFSTFDLLGWVILKAVVVWLITAPPAALLLYLVLIMIIKKNTSQTCRTLKQQ
jgi:uncharacterized protein (DUF2062 family)